MSVGRLPASGVATLGCEREWWHFDHAAGGPRYLDLALGCRDE